MKIRLSANSMVKLPESLADINLEYGYSYGWNKDTDKTWLDKLQVKFLSLIDKGVSKFKPLEEDAKKMVEYTAKATKFLNAQDETRAHIDGLDIQINLNSSFNKFLRNGIFALDEFLVLNAPILRSKLLLSLDSNVGHIYSLDKKMYIGDEIFKETDSFSMPVHVKNKLGLERATNILIFHEASHAFEHVNMSEHGLGVGPLFAHIRTVTMSLNESKREVDMINAKIRATPEWGTAEIDPVFVNNTYSLFREIYADVGSLLLQRNKDIEDGIRTKDYDIETVDVLIEARNREQMNGREKLSSSIYVGKYCHFSSPGLEELKKIYINDSLPNKKLTQKEIHDIASKCVEAGVSKVLLATINANNDNVGQLKTILNIIQSGIGNPYRVDIDDIQPRKYIDAIWKLKEHAGEEFNKNYQDKLALIDKNKILDQRAKWNAAFHKFAFKNDVAKSVEINEELEKLFGDSIEQKDSSMNDSLKQKTTADVMASFSQMRSKMTNSSSQKLMIK